ncbi:unnamed protein product [Phaeothamnion confervicola]
MFTTLPVRRRARYSREDERGASRATLGFIGALVLGIQCAFIIAVVHFNGQQKTEASVPESTRALWSIAVAQNSTILKLTQLLENKRDNALLPLPEKKRREDAFARDSVEAPVPPKGTIGGGLFRGSAATHVAKLAGAASDTAADAGRMAPAGAGSDVGSPSAAAAASAVTAAAAVTGDDAALDPIASSRWTMGVPAKSGAGAAVAARKKAGELSTVRAPGPHSALEEECEARFGYGLLEAWAANRETWCDGGDSGLYCYPHHHKHHAAGRKVLFCEGRNLVIDFAMVSGAPPDKGVAATAGMRPVQYLSFQRGSVSASCRKTSAYQESLFMPHHKLQMAGFRDGVATPAAAMMAAATDARGGGVRGGGGGGAVVVREPTYLLARDEDSENAFHSAADFLNMFMLTRILDLDVQDMQVVLFDRQADNPFYELIQTAFSPSYPLKRAGDYGGRIVVFERLIFHLESPAGLVFPSVMEPMLCRNSVLWDDYRRHVLQAFGLWEVPPPAVPKVVLIVRRRTPAKNVGRVLKNEVELAAVVREGNLIDFEVVDLAQLTFREQLQLLRRTTVLVGVHGAGLMNVLFLAEEAVLVEIHPFYRRDRHFRLAARLSGKHYLPYRGSDPRELTCSGSSDAIRVPPEEFRGLMDAAVRLARSFAGGQSECGLVCPAGILALDPGNDAHYARTGAVKGRPLSTKFPCR